MSLASHGRIFYKNNKMMGDEDLAPVLAVMYRPTWGRLLFQIDIY
jgi:hypothetical protein